MRVNRYTKSQPAQYKPRSLQELMMVPQYKRGQHDAIEEQLAETETALAQVDPLDVHSERAKFEQQKLYDQLTQQAEQLGSEGFTPTSKSDFLRLNKQYQQAISPTGNLGKIQAAKQAYNQNYKDYMEDTVKNKKWSREKALENWGKFAGQYTGFDEEDNITNIGGFGAPEKVELMTKLKDAKSLLGEQVVNELAAGNYNFARQEDGSLAVVNRSGRRIETSNAPNIQNALGMLNSELADPESAWRKSIEFEGLDPTLLSDQINKGFSSMLKNKVTDTRRQSINFTGVRNLNDAKENGEIDFEGYLTGVEKIYDDNTIKTLTKISEGKRTVNEMDYYNHGDPSILKAIADVISGKSKSKPLVLSEQTGELKTKVENIFNGLKRLGKLPDNADINNKEVLNTIITHMENNKNVVIEPNINKVSIQKGVEKAKDIVNQASSREFYDVETGKVLSYNQMVEKGYLSNVRNDNYANITYRGQMTADNMYSLKVDPNTSTNYVTPHVVKIGKKEFLVPESRSELNSSRKFVDNKFNKIFQKVVTSGNIPINAKFKMRGTDDYTDVEIKVIDSKDVNEAEYKNAGYSYMMNINGKMFPLTGSTFRNMSEDLEIE